MKKDEVYIIAEIGVNHDGCLEKAMSLIDVAIDCGCNAAKFQTFKSELVVSKFASKAEYQIKNTQDDNTQLEMIKKLELTQKDFTILQNYCGDKIDFISTPFDIPSLDFLSNELKIPMIKIPSGEITNAPFLLEVSKKRLPMVISTGMCSLGDIECALGVIAFGLINSKNYKPSMEAFLSAYHSNEGKSLLAELVTLLHCTSNYPASPSSANIRAMETLSMAFGLPVGYSDHTEGVLASILAVANGAKVIEKHITLNKQDLGPDHQASMEPNDFKEMVKQIRLVNTILGHSYKGPTPEEVAIARVARRSLATSKHVNLGDRWSENNLTVKRPGDGLSPFKYWEILGSTNDKKSYKADEILVKDQCN